MVGPARRACRFYALWVLGALTITGVQTAPSVGLVDFGHLKWFPACSRELRERERTTVTKPEEVVSQTIECGAGGDSCWNKIGLAKSFTKTIVASGGVSTDEIWKNLVPILNFNYGQEWAWETSTDAEQTCITRPGQKSWLSTKPQFHRVVFDAFDDCTGGAFWSPKSVYIGEVITETPSTLPNGLPASPIKCNFYPQSSPSGSSGGASSSGCIPLEVYAGTHGQYCTTNGAAGFCPPAFCRFKTASLSSGSSSSFVAALHDSGPRRCTSAPQYVAMYADYCRTNGAQGYCPAPFCQL